MAVAGRYAGSRRAAGEAKAKERRQKIFLGVGLVLLLIVLAIQLPKLMKGSHTSAAPATTTPTTPTAAPATAPTAATSPAVATRPVSKAALKRLNVYVTKDPFVQQVATVNGAVPTGTAATGPAVRGTHFVAKDPFVQQLVVAPAIPVGTTASSSSSFPAGSTTTPTKTATTGSKTKSTTTAGSSAAGYIVVIASVPLSAGRKTANHYAAQARQHGLGPVSVVNSTKYPSLRTGFWVVYTGTFATLSKTLAAVETARHNGYPSAYSRRLGH